MRKAPDFNLRDQDGNFHKLSDYQGRYLVLYFYPKDDTPGCTTEACSFRDARDALAEYGDAAVVGISKDTVKSHQKFATSHKLNFTLLSDPELKVIKAYGALGERKMFGKTFHGTLRNTYIIDPSGQIIKEYKNVSPSTHVSELLADLKKLKKA